MALFFAFFDKVKKFWKIRLKICSVNDIYGNINITKDNWKIRHCGFEEWVYQNG